jgi:hypothetical protein
LEREIKSISSDENHEKVSNNKKCEKIIRIIELRR